MKVIAQGRGFAGQTRDSVRAFEVKGHMAAAEQAALGLQLRQKLKLIAVAIHQMQTGDALRGAMGQPACDNVLVHRALRRCGGRLGVATGGKAQHIAAAIAGER